MAGVREKKKARTQESILRAAKKLFVRKGYRNTRIEDIAAEAEVGVGTAYNYFGSKRGLLLGLMNVEITEILIEGEKYIAGAGNDPVRALGDLIGIYLDRIRTWDKELLRELVASGIVEQGTGEELMKDDYRLMAQITNLVKKYQEDGVLDGKIEPDRITMIVYSILWTRVLMYMMLEGISIDLVKEEVIKDIKLVFHGWKES